MNGRSQATALGVVVTLAALAPWVAMYAPAATAAALLTPAVLLGALVGPWATTWRRLVVAALALIAAGSALTVLSEPPGSVGQILVLPARLLLDGWWQLLTVPLPVPAEPGFLALPFVLAAAAATSGVVGVQRKRFGLVAWPALALWASGLAVGLGAQAPLILALPLLLALAAAAAMTRTRAAGRLLGRAAAGACVLVIAAAAAVPISSAAAGMSMDAVDPREHVTPPQEDAPLVNPLDTLIGQLRSGDATPVFTATLSEPPSGSFWTVATLDSYDGRSWLSSDHLSPAATDIAEDLTGPVQRAEQTVTVSPELAPWVPHLGTVTGIHSGGLALGRQSDVLIDPAASDGAGEEEATYRLVGSSSIAEPAELEAAGTAPQPPGSPLLDAGCLPADVVSNIRVATNGTTNAFDRAAAVVFWLREKSGLQASQEVLSGHSCANLESNLAQAASAGAAPASIDQLATVQTLAMRSQGIPARLAVGYSVGTPDQDGTYTVPASYATAFTQIHLDGIGWIDIAADRRNGGAIDAEKASTAVSAAGQLESAAAEPPQVLPLPEVSGADTAPPTDVAAQRQRPPTALIVGTVLVALLTLWVAAARANVALRRRRRRTAADARSRVAGAWADVNETLRGCGLARPGRSAAETVAALPAELSAAESIGPLAEIVQRALYDPRPIDDHASTEAWQLAKTARRALTRSLPRRRRAIRFLVPARAAA